jgi:CarD family transcriptional regulator
MPSSNKTRKSAKAKTATRPGQLSAKATSRMSSTSGKSKTSKAAGEAASKARTAASRKAGSKAGSTSSSARSAAKSPRSSSAAKTRSVARSAAKGAARTGELKATNKAAAAKQAVKKAAEKAALKKAAEKAAAKKAAEKAAMKKAREKAAAKKAAEKIAAARLTAKEAAPRPKSAPKVNKNKGNSAKVSTQTPAVTETSLEHAKAPLSKKATDSRTAKISASPKPVAQTAAVVEIQPAKPVPGKLWAATRASMAAATAPDPRPAASAPVVHSQTSEQNPVTQKKSIPSAATKPARPVAEPPRAPAAKTAKPASAKLGFKTHEHIVYPAHGVGQIVAIEEQEVAGFRLELFVISFVKDKMILKVPTPKVVSVGMRKLAEPSVIAKSLDTLTGRARIKRTMWSRRAQEYEAKINSGDLIAIAEVVRDLYRSEAQPEQSYSERQLYEAALDRMSRELAVVQKLTEQESLKLIEAQLQKGPRRGSKTDAELEQDLDANEIDEAA